MALTNSAGAASAQGVNRLPALVGVAFALGLWMAAEATREHVAQVQQQLTDAGKTVLPKVGQTVPEAERSAAEARQRRQKIEATLQVTDPISFMQAKILKELRQRCAAEGIQGCAVKYFDEPARGGSQSAVPAKSPSDKATVTSVADLGLGKARAVVSGTFQDVEFRRFIDKLTARPDEGRWRINALVVRANSFEIDAELIIRPGLISQAKSP